MPDDHNYPNLGDDDAGNDLEAVVADDDDEARRLAALRLLITRSVAEGVGLRSGVALLRPDRNTIGEVQSTAPRPISPAGLEACP